MISESLYDQLEKVEGDADTDNSGLVYTSDALPGFYRKKRRDKFIYLSAEGRRLTDAQLLSRFESLAIPPAWKDVWICPLAQGHLQATGRDAKNRKQYIYHPQWEKIREMNRYGDMLSFSCALPRIRHRYEQDLKSRGMTREKVLALVTALLDTTLLRIGNPEYTRRNKSYGLTTLKTRHVDIEKSSVCMIFPSKGGKQQSVTLKNRRLSKLVRSCHELPGQRLFQYLDDSSQPRAVASTDVNEYLKTISGRDVTAKDFRTWGATVEAARQLIASPAADIRGRRKQITVAIGKVARRLGNTAAVCRKSYVLPALLKVFLSGSLPEIFAISGTADNLPDGLSPEERAVAWILQNNAGGAPASAGCP
jgi:DNA topoisomerase I